MKYSVFTEARGGHSFVLLVRQRHELAGGELNLADHCIVPYTELKDCGAVPGKVVIANSPSHVLHSQPFFSKIFWM